MVGSVEERWQRSDHIQGFVECNPRRKSSIGYSLCSTSCCLSWNRTYCGAGALKLVVCLMRCSLPFVAHHYIQTILDVLTLMSSISILPSQSAITIELIAFVFGQIGYGMKWVSLCNIMKRPKILICIFSCNTALVFDMSAWALHHGRSHRSFAERPHPSFHQWLRWWHLECEDRIESDLKEEIR